MFEFFHWLSATLVGCLLGWIIVELLLKLYDKYW